MEETQYAGSTAALRQQFQTYIYQQPAHKQQQSITELMFSLYPITDDIETLIQQNEDLKRCINSFRPFGVQALELQTNMKNEFTHRSNQLTGNVLTLGETISVIDQHALKGRPFFDQMQMSNHQAALEYLQEIEDENKDLSLTVLLNLHKLVLHQLDTPEANFLRDRRTKSGAENILKYNPTTATQEIEMILTAYHEQEGRIHPLLLAADTSSHLFSSQAFGPISGLVSRLVLNFLLMRQGYPLSQISSPGHEASYYQALEKAAKNQDLKPFRCFALGELKRSCMRCLQAFAMYSTHTEADKGHYFFQQIIPLIPKTHL